MSCCTGSPNCLCGCCAGTSVQTPQNEANPPGLPAITYRTGTWATFKESMLARLSSSDYPALAGLKTRENDDFTIALLDAASVMLDILTFYQERLANESYLRTAVQPRSLVELSRLIGYQPAPGVAATVYVAFTLKQAPGLPSDPSAPAISIPKGTQMQSVPAQGQKPQTFETSADILAKADWNAMPVQTGIPWTPRTGDTSVYLQGVATQLQPGDAVLVVGEEREQSAASQNWDIRLVTSAVADTVNNRTLVAWSEGLGDSATGVGPAQKNPRVYAFRQRAALFGYNAVSPLMLAGDARTNIINAGLLAAGNAEWKFGINPVDGTSLATDSLVDLDAVYSKLSPGTWLALIVPDKQTSRSPSGLVSLYRIGSVTTISRSGFSMSAKISRVATDTNANLSTYYTGTRASSALAQSELLPSIEQPLGYPLYGAAIDLRDLRPDLASVKAVALAGKAQKLRFNAGVSATIQFVPDDETDPVTLKPGDTFAVIDPRPLPLGPTGGIPAWSSSIASRNLRLADSSGRTGTVKSALSNFSLAPSAQDDPDVQEYALVSSIETATTPYPHTRIHLKSVVANCYDRASASVNANVGAASAGQSTTEILGNGSAATPNQAFTLKQAPLTFVQAPTPTGRQTTLQVSANGVKWTEVPSLYGEPPDAQEYSTLIQPGGAAQVLFGDGVEGSTLPTGQNNVQATYRIGSGAAGNVAAGSLTTLVDRPLGVGGVTNPSAATGGQDAQSIDDIRANAPMSVLTLGRAVSITDYQNYAATFAGIAKANAIWIPSGPGRGVFLTVAGVGGAELPDGNPTLANLVTSLHDFGNPLVPIVARSFLETLFSVEVDVKYDPKYDANAARTAVLVTLADKYSFARRTFGQGVSADEIAGVVQAVPGVIAVNVTKLKLGATSSAGDLAGTGYSLAAYNAWLAKSISLPRKASDTPTRICPYLPVANPTSLPYPAEILVLDPGPKGVVLGALA